MEPPASFFPTPNEIAGGIRWVRDHPVVATAAAAAATAVSVVSYFNAKYDSDDEDEVLDLANGQRDRGHTWSDDRRRRNSAMQQALPPRRQTLSAQSLERHPINLSPAEKSPTDDKESWTESEMSSSPMRRSMQSRMDMLTVQGGQQFAEEGVADADESDDVISPQWGWYVSITPPKEEYA